MSEVVIVKAGGGESPVPVAELKGPAFVKPGTGGTKVRILATGRECFIGGEALRLALDVQVKFTDGQIRHMDSSSDAFKKAIVRGAEVLTPARAAIVGEEQPVETFHKPVGTGAQNGLNLK